MNANRIWRPQATRHIHTDHSERLLLWCTVNGSFMPHLLFVLKQDSYKARNS